jgi:predicted amidohydrolase YtcJ
MAAIDAYTSKAAYLSFDDEIKGSLVPGKLPDFVC